MKIFFYNLKFTFKELFIIKKRLFIFPVTLFVICLILGMLWQSKTNISDIKIIDYSFLEIFKNNLKQSLLIILIGFITFGIGSSLLLMFNGFVTGSSIYVAYYKHGIISILTGILPHAPFELLATFIAMILSYESLRIIKKLIISHKKYKKIINKRYFIFRTLYKYLSIYFIVILLLFISSLIECYISRI